MKLKGDAIFALVLFAIFSFGTYRSLVMGDPAGGAHDVGAAFFPFWVCVLIQVLTAAIFVGSVQKSREAEVVGPGGEVAPMRERVILLTGIMLALFGYILVMEAAGFIASSIAFLVLVHQLWVFSENRRLSPLRELAMSAAFFGVTVVALFFIFNSVFHLALP